MISLLLAIFIITLLHQLIVLFKSIPQFLLSQKLLRVAKTLFELDIIQGLVLDLLRVNFFLKNLFEFGVFLAVFLHLALRNSKKLLVLVAFKHVFDFGIDV